jgi:site-specific recombinase XerD
MASIKVFLAINKQLKSGEYPIWIRIIIDRKVRYSSIGLSTKLEWWDEKKCIPNKKNPNRLELDTLLSKKIADAKKAIMDAEIDRKDYTAEEIMEITKKPKNATTVLRFYDEIIDRLKRANKIGNAAAYRDSKNALIKFTQGKDLSFVKIDTTFLNKFEEFLLGKNVSENSISVYFRTLRSLFNKAIQEKLIKIEKYPFNVYKISKLSVKTKKRAISMESIQKISNLDFEIDSLDWHSKNYFLFSFYTMGTNIEDGRLKYKRMKTGNEYNIKLLAPALEILDYYLKHQKSNYIFPMLNNTIHISPTQIHNRVKKVTKQINASLKSIGVLCEIEIKLTTYVARHSFATVLKRNGVSTSIISEAMKHDTEKTTQIYLDSFENSVIDDANETLLNSFTKK